MTLLTFWLLFLAFLMGGGYTHVMLKSWKGGSTADQTGTQMLSLGCALAMITGVGWLLFTGPPVPNCVPATPPAAVTTP